MFEMIGPDISKSYCGLWSDLQNVIHDSTNPHFRSKYAKLPTVLDSVRELLKKHKFSISQPLSTEADDKTYVYTILMHESGGRMVSKTIIKVANPDDPQKLGSGISYIRRYALLAILGIATDDEDDDAEMAKTKRVMVQKTKPAMASQSEVVYVTDNEMSKLFDMLVEIPNHRESEEAISALEKKGRLTVDEYAKWVNRINQVKKEKKEETYVTTAK